MHQVLIQFDDELAQVIREEVDARPTGTECCVLAVELTSCGR